jgi:DNA-binding NtrC family response regulator
VLLAIADSNLKKRVGALLKKEDVVISLPRGSVDFWKMLSTETFDFLIIEDHLLPRPRMDSIATIRALPERPEVVVLSEHEDPADPETRARLLAAGCIAVITPLLSDTMLSGTLQTLVDRRREATLGILKAGDGQQRMSLNDVVSKSPTMQRIMEIARRVVDTDTTLLLLGETGVGKEWMARAIHDDSPRATGPFVAVNCGAIPETLLESELFGHVEGAFTGANRAHRGHFELAHGGTLFLDEIAEMPLHLQAKLLRVLQEFKIKRVGGEHEIETDVRLMAATNRDLEEEMQARRFRPDLFYRIGVVTLTLPPLRERQEDIPDLVRTQLAHFQTKLNRRLNGITAEAMAALETYDWPGNVRELINVLERAVLLCDTDRLSVKDLPRGMVGSPVERSISSMTIASNEAGGVAPELLDLPLKDAREDIVVNFEKAYFSELLTRNGGRVGVVARRAGITPRSLYGKMKRYGLRKEDFKD